LTHPVEGSAVTKAAAPNPLMNRLLGALPIDIYQGVVLPHVQFVPLHLGQELYGPGQTLDCVYFPTTAVVSMLCTMESGASAEMAVVGNDGILGIALFMGGGSVPNRAVVQIAGAAFRMRGSALVSEFRRGGIFQQLLLRYTQSLIAQMAQTAVCNRLHSVEQRLCRWLLLCQDRLPSNEIVMTQELIGDMLGVTREAVSHEASLLQDAGLIEYQRGHITILDRPGLEARACECYSVVRRETERLMSSPSDQFRP
jgi:Crp-like helix-turn-helix protein